MKDERQQRDAMIGAFVGIIGALLCLFMIVLMSRYA